MKRMLAFIGICLLLSGPLDAQKRFRALEPEEKAMVVVGKLEKEIRLNPLQKEQMVLVLEKSFTNNHAYKYTFRNDKEKRKIALRKDREETHQAFQKILEPEQYRQLLRLKKGKQSIKYYAIL